MKKPLLNKYYACLAVGMAFIVSAMLFSATANAQIVYTDVIPDSTMYCTAQNCISNYNLDLNNDANNDFILTAEVANNLNGMPIFRRVTASPLNGNAVKDSLVNSINISIPLQFNAVIDSNLLIQQSWQTSGLNIMKTVSLNSGYGLWDSLSDYYLGLRLLQSGQTYYGWVRLRVDVTIGYASVIIRDYAYNSLPDQPILAGQTTATGITENAFASSINIFPNPAKDKLTIALGSYKQKVEVTIADITGKIVYSTIASETQKIEVNTKDFAAGIYIVKIQTEDLITTKKLVVEK